MYIYIIYTEYVVTNICTMNDLEIYTVHNVTTENVTIVKTKHLFAAFSVSSATWPGASLQQKEVQNAEHYDKSVNQSKYQCTLKMYGM